MFSAATVSTGMNLEILSVSYIDSREFAGVQGAPILPGPYGYQLLIAPKAIDIVPNVMFNLSGWLADGLLVGPLFDLPSTRPGAQHRLF